MRTKGRIILVCVFLIASLSVSAQQIGIRGGVNMSNEIKSFEREEINNSFKSENLNSFHVGVVFQYHQKKNPALGFEVGALLAQKGSAFNYENVEGENLIETIQKGYREVNFIEIPLNLRFRFSLGIAGIYGFGGMYGAYALGGKTVGEATDEISKMSFGEFSDRLDFGYSFGLGVELLRKLQLGATWSRGLKNTAQPSSENPTEPTDSKFKVFSVNLTFLF
ncbi:MAG: PorT family protein [Prevotellaceae bacterium]|jgi:hypothetical protein|nr:PorT family protein [Prevotellaceae bacterium]